MILFCHTDGFVIFFQYDKCLEACRTASIKLFDFFRMSVERKLSKVLPLHFVCSVKVSYSSTVKLGKMAYIYTVNDFTIYNCILAFEQDAKFMDINMA